MVVVSTATPAKFPDTLKKVNVPVPVATWVEKLEGREEKKLFLNTGENWEEKLRETISSSAGFM